MEGHDGKASIGGRIFTHQWFADGIDALDDGQELDSRHNLVQESSVLKRP